MTNIGIPCDRKKLDRGEKTVLQAVCPILGRDLTYESASLLDARNRMLAWADTSSLNGLTDHLFYCYYTAMLHMGSVAKSIEEIHSFEIAPDDVKEVKPSVRWFGANCSFPNGCLRVFAAIDLVGHLVWAKDFKPTSNIRYNSATYEFEELVRRDWITYFYDYNGIRNDAKHSKIDFCRTQLNVDLARVLLRHYHIHRTSFYLVPFCDDQNGEYDFHLIDPRTNLPNINLLREKVQIAGINGWKEEAPQYCFPLEATNPIPASKILKSCLDYSFSALTEGALDLFK